MSVRGTSSCEEDAPECITPFQQLVSSCIGAIVTSVFVTPLDVVKIRLQAQQKTFTAGKSFIYCNGLWDHVCCCDKKMSSGGKVLCQWYERPGHFHGTVDAFAKIVRHEGITSLWSGLPPTLVMAVPATMLYFTAYDQMMARMLSELELNHQPAWVPSLCGSLARVVTVTAVSPLEFMRTKLQSERMQYSDVYKATSSLIKQHGILSLWHGWGPTILRDVPFSAMYWTFYEFIKQCFNHDEYQVLLTFMSGALAGMVAAVITLPFDVVKTHRQIELGEADILQSNRRVSTAKVISALYRKNGITSLFAGLTPRLIKVAPACAIMISTYEYGKYFFTQKNVKKKKENYS